jgi:hypothetical protein
MATLCVDRRWADSITIAGASWASPAEGAVMDSTLLLALAIALAVAVIAVLLIRRRQRAEAPGPAESQVAVSTEGMKICPKCGMGNLWTDRACISCNGPLKG